MRTPVTSWGPVALLIALLCIPIFNEWDRLRIKRMYR